MAGSLDNLQQATAAPLHRPQLLQHRRRRPVRHGGGPVSPPVPEPHNETAIRELIGHGKLLEGLLLGVQSQVQTSLTQLAETNGRMERLEDRIGRLERDGVTSDQLKSLADTVAALARSVADKPSSDQLQAISATLQGITETVTSLKSSNDRRRGGTSAASNITNLSIAFLAMVGTLLAAVAALRTWFDADRVPVMPVPVPQTRPVDGAPQHYAVPPTAPAP